MNAAVPCAPRAYHCKTLVGGVTIELPGGELERIACGAVVNCGGPFAGQVNAQLCASSTQSAAPRPLPLENEIHAKTILRDDRGVVPDNAPMVIWQACPWLWRSTPGQCPDCDLAGTRA